MGRPKGSKNKPKVSLPTKKKTLNNNNNKVSKKNNNEMASASKHYSTRSKISKNGLKSKTTATQSQLVLKPYHQNENDEMEEELEEELEERRERRR